MAAIPTKSLEFMLAGWTKSDKRGMVVSFFVLPEDEAYFENATARKGKIAGQRYAGVLVQLTDQETPDPESVKPAHDKPRPPLAPDVAAACAEVDAQLESQRVKNKSHAHFPTGLTGLAIRWCNDPHFQAWVAAEYGALYADAERREPTNRAMCAKMVLCELLGIKSRSQIDQMEDVSVAFREDIMKPYIEQREADGVA